METHLTWWLHITFFCNCLWNWWCHIHTSRWIYRGISWPCSFGFSFSCFNWFYTDRKLLGLLHCWYIALKCKPSANWACAVPLMDGPAVSASSWRRVWHGLAMVVDRMRESTHTLHYVFLCLQGTGRYTEQASLILIRMRTAYWWVGPPNTVRDSASLSLSNAVVSGKSLFFQARVILKPLVSLMGL